jgi:hypothetical protein
MEQHPVITTNAADAERQVLTPAEQAIVDLVECEGPKTSDALDRVMWNLGWPSVQTWGARDALLSGGLLLERERTVECNGHLGARCYSCSGIGFVTERVIGRPCRAGCVDGVLDEVDVGVGDVSQACHCSSTPTPGLDPGSEDDTI